MASSPNSSAFLVSLFDGGSSTRTVAANRFPRHQSPPSEGGRNVALLWRKKKSSFVVFSKKQQENAMQYRKLGDSDLVISEITLGTVSSLSLSILLTVMLRIGANLAMNLCVLRMMQMTFGEQNTEKEAHEQLSYAFEHGINALDTAEMVWLNHTSLN